MAPDKPNLGTKHECEHCGIKYYDLGNAEPVCPQCGTPLGAEEPEETQEAGDSEEE